VNELMAKEWYEELYRENFWSIDVNSIMSIPLSQCGTKDLLLGDTIKMGCFL
jgi:hypothetical protein